jgi:SAM-dependent methyltransferase
VNAKTSEELDVDLTRAKLGPAESAIFETFVVPRYLRAFGELLVEMLADGDEAQVAHVLCRTGYPDHAIARRLPGAHIHGCDPSPYAIELARAKASTTPEMVGDYRLSEALPVPLPSSAFSHALSVHPVVRPRERARLLAECTRLLAPHGQAVLAIPLRGSFQELFDLFREFALKHEAVEVMQAVEHASLVQPTTEMFAAELEGAGLQYVEVELRTSVLEFESGRGFFEDPITRLALLPELRGTLAMEDVDQPLAYVRDAIDKYWSDATFELTVNVGCATGRKPPDV